MNSSVKTMNYELRRLVCSQEEKHILMIPGANQSVEIIPDTVMYFKVNVFGKQAPGKLIVRQL
jgi:hypothetical protein